ncbi:Demethylsterigmatocystin 6-O-methyltransferase [Cladobotryum mycophilum]|uniref:Demethylsterigmatocystin 6-O-methyltransferase n=1 Tax=Cladobotryum mycophilum TaxID=491253 RepID=A0ABR0SIV0_9HYPO
MTALRQLDLNNKMVLEEDGFREHPEDLGYFNDYMAFRHEPQLSWLTVYPTQEEDKDWDPERPLYINIDIPGRVILQDLSHSIAKALLTPSVENMVHDFFKPQPIKGAKFYFSRGVLHNHPGHKVRHLLKNTKSALGPDSIIPLGEMVLPEKGVNAYTASMELTMMAAFAAMERSEAQWHKILEDVGLKLVKTYTYNTVSYESVMDMRLP